MTTSHTWGVVESGKANSSWIHLLLCSIYWAYINVWYLRVNPCLQGFFFYKLRISHYSVPFSLPYTGIWSRGFFPQYDHGSDWLCLAVGLQSFPTMVKYSFANSASKARWREDILHFVRMKGVCAWLRCDSFLRLPNIDHHWWSIKELIWQKRAPCRLQCPGSKDPINLQLADEALSKLCLKRSESIRLVSSRAMDIWSTLIRSKIKVREVGQTSIVNRSGKGCCDPIVYYHRRIRTSPLLSTKANA